MKLNGMSNKLTKLVQCFKIINKNSYQKKSTFNNFLQIFLIGLSIVTTGIAHANPDDNIVTRAEIAKPLLQAKYGQSFNPEEALGGEFLDVNAGDFNADWIEKLVQDEITEGCATNYYCPNMIVNKEQLAIMLLKTRIGSNYLPDIADGTIFNDINMASFSADWIETLANEDISIGCDENNNYCPKEAVSIETFETMLTNSEKIRGAQNLTIQADVDALVGVTKIIGDLTLSPTADLDLSSLNTLQEVTGNLKISSNSFQTTLSGLSSLETVGGDLQIRLNNNLQSISGFSALSSVGGRFWLSDNPELLTIAAFPELLSVDSYFSIVNNPKLTSLGAFPKLETIANFFAISDNPELLTLPSFPELLTIGNLFQLNDNDKLASLGGFPKLTSVGANLDINRNYVLTGLTGFSVLSSANVVGNIGINSNTLLDCSTPEPSFTPVNSSAGNAVNCPIILIGNQFLTTQAEVDAMAGVITISGDLTLNPTANLNLSPLNSLEEITGTLRMQSNSFQTTFLGLSSLETVGGDLQIRLNNNLESISGFSALSSVGGNLSLSDNPDLLTIANFPELLSVGSFFSIVNNAKLTNLGAFPKLETIANFFAISNNPELLSIPAFPELLSVGNLFQVNDNDKLASLGSFPKLTSVGANLDINGNDVLTSLPSFSVLSSMGVIGNIAIKSNALLDCSAPEPSFTPVNSSISNAVNCAENVGIVAFAYVNEETNTSTYVPDTDYSYNSSGSGITAKKLGLGRYRVTFTGLLIEPRSNVQVSAYDFAENKRAYCNLSDVLSNVSVLEVWCFDAVTDFLIDSKFTIAISQPTTDSTANVTAYVYNDDVSSHGFSFIPLGNKFNKYNSSGIAVQILRSSVGRYRVTFADGAFTNQESIVLVHSTQSTSHCSVKTWTSNRVDIYCFDPAVNVNDPNDPNLRDSEFVISVIETDTSAADVVGYALANEISSASYTPDISYSYNPSGSITATRTATGNYGISFSGIDLSTMHYHVTAENLNERYCNPTSVSSSSLNVRCFDRTTNSAVDSLYHVLLIKD